MEDAATYYRMQSRPAPSSHGIVSQQQQQQQQQYVQQQHHQQQQPQARLTKNSQEYQDRKALPLSYNQFPNEWKRDIQEEKDPQRRLIKFEEYKRKLVEQQQQQRGAQSQQGTVRQMPAGMISNRAVHVVSRNSMQQPPQATTAGVYSQNGNQMVVRRSTVVVNDQNRASPIPNVRVVSASQGTPSGTVMRPANATVRMVSAARPGGSQPPQGTMMRRVVTTAGLEDGGPLAKRQKLTPSPPSYGSPQQQMVYMQQSQQQQEGGQQVVYIQQGGRVQSPNGTVYVTQTQPDGTVVLVPANEGGIKKEIMVKQEPYSPQTPQMQIKQEPGVYSQQTSINNSRPEPMYKTIKAEPGVVYAQQSQQQQPRTTNRGQIVYVRASDMQNMRRTSGVHSSSPSPVPVTTSAGDMPSVSSAQQQYHQGGGPPVLTRAVLDQQNYLQPSGTMHKSSSMPVFTAQRPMSPQVTAMRSPATAGGYAVPSPGGEQQHGGHVRSPLVSQPVTSPPQPVGLLQQQQGGVPYQQQQQMQGGIPQQQQQQGIRSNALNQNAPNAQNAQKNSPEYKEQIGKLRKRLWEDMNRIFARMRIDEIKPPQEFDLVMQVLSMRRFVPIEKLDQIARIGDRIVERNMLAWPLTQQIRELAKSGGTLSHDVPQADPWGELVRHKSITLPPEVLKAIA